jgi:phage antirepressor YoqD-like protein
MNDLILPNGANSVKTMTSREIALLTAKDHRNVLADARTMLESLGIDCADFSAQYIDASGKSNPMFVLPKRETLILVSGYSVAMRAKIIDRWQELETQAIQPVELSRMDILTMAIDSERRAVSAETQLTLAAPKADAFDRIAAAVGSVTIREAAKTLQMAPLAFSNWLRGNRWIFKQGKGNLAFQPRIDSGYMEHKVTLVEAECDDGTTYQKSVSQPRITQKGLVKLAQVVPGAGVLA